MRLLVSGATVAVKAWHARRPDRVGVFLTPGKGMVVSMLGLGIPYAADNGCFSRYDPDAIERMLAVLAARPDRPLFFACPDVVGDAPATLTRFRDWGPRVRALGIPVALVGQDGLTPNHVDWDAIDAYFVGGSTEWKLSRESHALVRHAKTRGKHVHMGRVNSCRRIRVAAVWGV